ncbi:PKD domain-containing protein [Kitasatospora sp. NPDC049285]|uniref:PKD domain-containing protein n=1 Tax=Kitasatospora sp. NPDC049285 TaxID=3157096 RepID=UPI003429B49F
MRSRRVTAAAIVVLAAAGSLPSATAAAAVTDLYVDQGNTACTDAGSGSKEVPYCHVGAAAKAVGPGQTVHLASGVHEERIVLTHSGTPDAPITFTGPATGSFEPGAETTVRGITVLGATDVRFVELYVDGASVSAEAVRVAGASRVELNRMRVRGQDADGGSAAVHVTGHSAGVTLSQSWVTGGRVVVDQASSAIVSTNQISFGPRSGITVDGAQGTAVTSNSVGAACGPQVLVTGGSTGTTVENNVLTGTAKTDGCTAGAQRDLEVSADSAAGTVAKYNSLLADPTPYLWGGKTYATAEDFQTATGQGERDVVKPTTAQLDAAGIDSADALAPGELPVSQTGSKRIDAPGYPNTGTGVGYYDRGAGEQQNPMVLGLALAPAQPAYALDVALDVQVTSPWFPATATLDFGDGTGPSPVTAGPVSHGYPYPGNYQAVLTVTDDTGYRKTTTLTVRAAADPVSTGLTVQHPAEKDRLTVRALPKDLSSPLPVVKYRYDFGDGTAAVESATAAPVDHRYAKSGPYQVTLTVTDDHGRSASASSPVTVGTAYVPLTMPRRVMDTRSGLGAPKAKVGPNGTVKLKVTGTPGIPDDGSVASVLVNLTGTGASEPTHVIAYDGGQRPDTSNLNAVPGRDVGNAAMVPVAADGTITVYNHGGSLDLIADLQGYYSTGKVPSRNLYASDAVRVLDTRTSHPVGPDGTVTFNVRELPGQVPAGASVVVLNVTATGADQDTYVTANPVARPVTYSSLNVSRGATVSNQVTAPIDAAGNVTLYNHVGSVHLIADLQGFYGSDYPNAGQVVPITPVRALDTRTTSKLNPFEVRGINARSYGVPAGASAVLVNLTGLNATEEGWQALIGTYAVNASPGTSNLNLTPGAVVPNLALVPINQWGYFSVVNHAGTADAIVDIQGYVIP